jgi:rubrerythrin
MMNNEPIHQDLNIPGPEHRGGEMTLIWRCTNCGFIFDQFQDVPESCPSCGAHKEFFEQVRED